MKLLGIVDYMNTCDCCGRTDLKCTVAFDTDDGIVYYGRTCATRWYGKPTKAIKDELATIKEVAYQEAYAEWKAAPENIAYRNRLDELSKGPCLPWNERKPLIEPFSEPYEAKRKEISQRIASKYMLKESDIRLH
jgi:hypothetical protein